MSWATRDKSIGFQQNKKGQKKNLTQIGRKAFIIFPFPDLEKKHPRYNKRYRVSIVDILTLGLENQHKLTC